MSDLVVSNPSPVFLHTTDIRAGLAGVGGLTLGQSVYLDPTTGTYLPTDATNTAKVAFRGVVTAPAQGAGVGQAVDVTIEGYVAGLDVSALAFDALVYLSNTVGKLGTAAGTNSAVAGRVVALSDRDPVTSKPSKILYVRPTLI
jgi:hypothetical protein